jgi:hypothetical protein
MRIGKRQFLKSISDLPHWFDLDSYDFTAMLDRNGWREQLFIRYQADNYLREEINYWGVICDEIEFPQGFTKEDCEARLASLRMSNLESKKLILKRIESSPCLCYERDLTLQKKKEMALKDALIKIDSLFSKPPRDFEAEAKERFPWIKPMGFKNRYQLIRPASFADTNPLYEFLTN